MNPSNTPQNNNFANNAVVPPYYTANSVPVSNAIFPSANSAEPDNGDNDISIIIDKQNYTQQPAANIVVAPKVINNAIESIVINVVDTSSKPIVFDRYAAYQYFRPGQTCDQFIESACGSTLFNIWRKQKDFKGHLQTASHYSIAMIIMSFLLGLSFASYDFSNLTVWVPVLLYMILAFLVTQGVKTYRFCVFITVYIFYLIPSVVAILGAGFLLYYFIVFMVNGPSIVTAFFFYLVVFLVFFCLLYGIVSCVYCTTLRNVWKHQVRNYEEYDKIMGQVEYVEKHISLYKAIKANTI
ncbi:hypothetical protein WA158_002092 [Blastocystis sp. Blastoise]